MALRWLALLFGGLPTLLSCNEVEVVETQVVLSWGQGDLDAFCIEDEGVDTYLVDIFSYEGPLEATGVHSPCRLCTVESEEGASVSCEVLEHLCLCGRSVHSTGEVVAALRGFSIDHVAPEVPICVRIVALRRQTTLSVEGELVGECPAGLEECAPGWLDGANLDPGLSRVDFCSVSDPHTPGGTESAIYVREISCRRIQTLWAEASSLIRNLERVCEQRSEELGPLCEEPDPDYSFESCLATPAAREPE